MAVYSTYGPVKPPIRFSRQEVGQIVLAVAVLTFAFTLLLMRLYGFLGALILAAVAVPSGFLLHELGHKVVAQRYGFFAEFRAWYMGLVLAVFTAFFGFLFAAPGAVMIQGFGSTQQTGRISAAGPGVNLAIGGPFALIWFLLTLAGFNFALGMSITLIDVVGGVAFINVLLGTFNMIPIPPLDGSKIVRWDLKTYILLLVPLAALVVLGFLYFSPFF
jgi:Zn-dependent protease